MEPTTITTDPTATDPDPTINLDPTTTDLDPTTTDPMTEQTPTEATKPNPTTTSNNNGRIQRQ